MNLKKIILLLGLQSQQLRLRLVVLLKLRAWHQKHLDQQNPIKVQQISDQEKMKQMEREIKELKRANEILRKAAAFFAQAELDRPHK